MSEKRTGGIGVLGLLGVLFVGLKLTHYIDWSWWWVTLPFWGMFAVFAAVISICDIVIGFCKAAISFLETAEKRKRS